MENKKYILSGKEKILFEGLCELKDKWSGIKFYDTWMDKNYHILEKIYFGDVSFDELSCDAMIDIDCSELSKYGINDFLCFENFCYYIWSTIPRVIQKKYNLLEENK